MGLGFSIPKVLDRWRSARNWDKSTTHEGTCADRPEAGAETRDRLQAVASMESFLGITTEDATNEVRYCGSSGVGPGPPPGSDVTSDPINADHPLPLRGARYRVLRHYARGGLGDVYVARDLELGREVALKEIQRRFADDTSSQARFVREAEVTGRLEHPGIVPVHGFGHDGEGRPYYVMRLIRGETLAEAIALFHRSANAAEGPGPRALTLRQLLGRFVDVCDIVAYAHSRGVLHRDIKSANIMLGPYGETLLVDWGLARLTDPVERPNTSSERGGDPPCESGDDLAPTRTGTVLGTPAYMSPEQAAGNLHRLGPVSDVYSLGATLYHLLTGRPPIEDGDVDLVLRRVQGGEFPSPRQANGSVPPVLEAICLKAMALHPEDRYPTARDLADDIERWLADEPVAVLREPGLSRISRWARRHKTLTASTAMLLGTAFVALFISTILISHEQAQTKKALDALIVAQQERALGRIDALLHSGPQALSMLLGELASSPAWIETRLRELLRGDLPPEQGRRVRLALLPFDSHQAEALGRDLLECRNDEFMVIAESLRPYHQQLSTPLWSALHDPSQPRRRRFLAGMALARFEPGGTPWKQADHEFLATELLNSNSDEQRELRDCLRPISASLIPTLRVKFSEDAAREAVREAAANALAEYARDDPALIADLVSRSSADQYLLLLPVLQSGTIQQSKAVQTLGVIASEATSGDSTEPERLAVGMRRARAVIALIQLGASRAALRGLRDTGDLEVLSQVSHQARERGLRPAELACLLDSTADLRERFALLLTLGEFQPAEMPETERSRLAARLLDWYAHDPSRTIHGAVGWLLRTWGLGREAAVVDRTPLDYDPDGVRSWFVQAVGEDRFSFVVCPPGEFFMGSPVTESDRDNDEGRHQVVLGRAFAVGMHEVTREQFARYRCATGGEMDQLDADPRSPAVGVTWYEAVSYCRWITRQAGLTESDQCYANPAPLEKDPEGFPKNWQFHPERRGFRLPSEAEWEYACRAGTVTPFSFGSDRKLLLRYGWFQENAGRGPRGWGELRPNFFGLFDLHGNAVEWCHDRYVGYDSSPALDPFGDLDSKYRVYRGGAWTGGARLCRSADRDLGVPTDRAYLGFRLARTLSVE